MKDVDTLLHHPDLLIHQYLATSSLMRCHDFQTRPFAYIYDVFNSCSKPRHVIAPSRVLISTSSSVPTPPILRHYSNCFLQVSSLLYLPKTTLPTSNLVISPEQFTWLYVDYTLPSFSPFLFPWLRRTIHHHSFETHNFHYHITSSLPFLPIHLYTTKYFNIFYYHLQRLS